MATRNVWCLLIDLDWKRVGTPFKVPIQTDIADLRDAVKEKKSLDLKDFTADGLRVLHCKARLLSTQTEKQIDTFLDNLDLNDEENIFKLASGKTLMSLGLAIDEVLLVQMPAVWCLLIDQNAKRVGGLFKMPVQTHIAGLKDAIKKKKSPKLNDFAADRLRVLRCKTPLLSIQKTTKEIDAYLSNLQFDDDSFIGLAGGETVRGLELTMREVLLIQLPVVQPIVSLESVPNFELELRNADPSMLYDIDAAKWAKNQYDTLNDTAQNPGLPPASRSKSNIAGYTAVQTQRFQTIYDGLMPAQSSQPIYSTYSPPVHIYHPIFDEFASLVNDPKIHPTQDDLKNVVKFMSALSKIYQSEAAYKKALLEVLDDFLGYQVSDVANRDSKVQADAAIVDGTRILMLLEFKYFIGTGGSDPSVQAGISMRRYWIDSSRKLIRNKYSCATFLLAAAGPWFCVMGGVFTDRVIVQRLTDMKWTALSSTEDEWRILENAKVLGALRSCLQKLKNQPPTCDELSKSNCYRPHPRFFPHPTQYTDSDGNDVCFKYMMPLEADQTTCATFRAEVAIKGGHRKVVVKFVSRYGQDVHKYLANKGRAPQLFYVGPLSGKRDVDGTTSKPGAMQMVVMEYIAGNKKVPKDAKAQIKEILDDLHSAGYVFGYLRKPNLLFDQNDKALLIDFNWCGHYDTKIHHKGLSEKVLNAIKKKKEITSGENVGKEYAKYPMTISESKDMWASGVQASGFILPEHDLEMLEKLVL